jgi:uncharacterized protein (DUF58 family)
VPNRLPVWFSARFVWALAGVALLLACTPGVALFEPVAVVAALALAAATILDVVRLPRADALRVTRELPPHFSLRRSAELRYTIENASARGLVLELFETPMRTLDAGERGVAVTVAPHARTIVPAVVVARARGTDAFSHIYVSYQSTLGLVRRRTIVDAPEVIRVYPNLAAVERYGSLHARNRLVEAGLRRMRLRGVGSEFESLRDYEAGDAFRTIDWKATARRGKLMVTQREVERSQDVMLLLDCGRLMTARVGNQRKLDYAVTAGLSLASIASLASDRVGVVAFARRILLARSPRATSASVRALADALCDLEPVFEEPDYAHAFSYLRSHVHRRSLIVFLTDVIDPVSQSAVLAELGSLARRHVVLCVFMNDQAIVERLESVPAKVEDAYALDVALGLSEERVQAARRLTREGIITLDVPAARLSVAAIDEYLRIKSRGLL